MRLFVAAALVACASSRPLADRPVTRAATVVFIEDDYPRALATAKKEHKALFVDVWAPWCHTCLSMRAYVLRDPALTKLADKYVWAAIDSEKPNNAAFVAKYPIEAWPTLLVIDPATEKATLKWLGAATVSELTMLLTDSGTAEGDRAAAEGRVDEAIAAYRIALAANTNPEQRARIVDKLLGQLGKVDKPACAKLAREEFPKLAKGTSRANVALAGYDCAAATEREPLADALTTIVIDPTDPILADDRSALYEVLVEHRKQLGDKAGAKKLAAAWAMFLEGEANKAKDPAARAVFDVHRMTAYFELGEPARAIPMLEQSEKDFPSDYNPPARLAKVHLVMDNLPAARSAIDRALGRAYGPRTLRLLALKADIAKTAGDTKAEKSALDDAIALGASLSLPKGYTKLIEQLKARRAALDVP
jgi:thiol-disulfide isomerase/thioredoxin